MVSAMENRKSPGLTTAIFIGLALGAAAGILLHYAVPEGKVRDVLLIDGIFYLIGNGFLRLMQMLVVPLVFCSLVCGSMSMGDTKKLGKIGVKTLGFYLATTALAIIPVNPVRALADGDMLSIILFALIVGMILAGLGEAVQTVGNLFSQFNDVMMQMTVMVMKLAPYGVFCLTARTFSGIGFDAFLPLFKYMAGVMIALAIQGLVVYMAILKGFTGLSPVKFLKKFLPVMGFAFSTATSNATIPMSIDTLHRKMGVPRRISSFTIPLGATINMDGTAIMQGVAVVFASQAFGIHLSVADYLTVILTATLASVGTAGVPGVGLITLSMVFASVGLPVEAIALIMGIDRILDMSRTAVNITGDAVCTTVVAFQDGGVDRAVFENMEAGRDG